MPHFDCASDLARRAAQSLEQDSHLPCERCRPTRPADVDGVPSEIVDMIWLLERSRLASVVDSGIPTPERARAELLRLIAEAIAGGRTRRPA